jgi:hypothetical protein
MSAGLSHSEINKSINSTIQEALVNRDKWAERAKATMNGQAADRGEADEDDDTPAFVQAHSGRPDR